MVYLSIYKKPLFFAWPLAFSWDTISWFISCHAFFCPDFILLEFCWFFFSCFNVTLYNFTTFDPILFLKIQRGTFLFGTFSLYLLAKKSLLFSSFLLLSVYICSDVQIRKICEKMKTISNIFFHLVMWVNENQTNIQLSKSNFWSKTDIYFLFQYHVPRSKFLMNYKSFYDQL